MWFWLQWNQQRLQRDFGGNVNLEIKLKHNNRWNLWRWNDWNVQPKRCAIANTPKWLLYFCSFSFRFVLRQNASHRIASQNRWETIFAMEFVGKKIACETKKGKNKKKQKKHDRKYSPIFTFHRCIRRRTMVNCWNDFRCVRMAFENLVFIDCTFCMMYISFVFNRKNVLCVHLKFNCRQNNENNCNWLGACIGRNGMEWNGWERDSFWIIQCKHFHTKTCATMHQLTADLMPWFGHHF